MKTKDKILVVALHLFNQYGVSKISSRNISDELGISYGNLTYYFPKKDDIILQLYVNMQNELDEQFRNIQKEVYQFEFMLKSFRVMLEVFRKYKFLFLDFAGISRRLKQIKEHYRQQFEKQKAICLDIARFLTEKGYAKKEKVTGHYEMLIHGMLLVCNSWVSDAEFLNKIDPTQQVDYYLEMIYSLLRSSLTSEGLKAFQEVYHAFHKPL